MPMLDLPTLTLFAAACLALTATPGPDMLLIISQSVSQGRASGFATLAGIQIGTYCHALAAAFGLSELFLAVPIAYEVVRYAGAAYLLYLAWKTVFSREIKAVTQEAPSGGMGEIFRQGLATNLLNPKMALFVLALFPQFVRPDQGSVALQIMILATILNLIGLVVNGSVIMAASSIGNAFMKRGGHARLGQLLLGTVFAGLALRLTFDSRN